VLEEARTGTGPKIITSVVSKVEVANVEEEGRKRVIDPQVEQKIDAFWANYHLIEIVELHDTIALAARKLMRTVIDKKMKSLKAMDAIHLASAQWLSVSEFHTYDVRLSDYANLLGLTIREPDVPQPRLPNI